MKTIKKIGAVALAALTVASVPAAFTGCGGAKNDPNVLNIVALNAGYGKEWITTLAKKFEEDHPGYKVDLSNVIYQAPSLITSHINSKNNIDDLYISVGTSWKTYAAQGKFAALDDLLDETVDGVKVIDKIADEYRNSVYMPDRNGDLHTYRLPWTAGVGGIYYNKTLFDEYEWDIPQTYDELITLCQTIYDENIQVKVGNKTQQVMPFVYTGANIDYFDYVVYTWWAQLSGEQAIKEFTQYSSADNYDYTKNPTYANLKTATEMWHGIFGNSKYVMPDCSSKSNHDAQTDFNNGYAVMMFNGDWLYNEILDYKIDNDFELAIMKTPVAHYNEPTGNPEKPYIEHKAVETSITYTIGEDQYVAIPASSTKKELAKDFIKLMMSDYGYEVFMNQAHGLLAYKPAGEVTSTDKFMNNLLSVKTSYDKAFTNYPSYTADEIAGDKKVRDNRLLYLSNLVDIWGTGGLRPFGNILTGGKKIDAAFSEIGTEIGRQWTGWRQDVNLE